MIILSQDKETIVNFDNLIQIYITKDEEKTSNFIRYEAVDSLYEDLGKYSTEERAKEVLQEITDTFIGISALENIEKDLTFDENTQVRIRPKVYYMPKE